MSKKETNKKNGTKGYLLNIPINNHTELKQLSETKGVHMSEMINFAIDEFLNGQSVTAEIKAKAAAFDAIMKVPKDRGLV